MATPAIEIEHLSKEYPYGFLNLKKKISLEDLSMRVDTGEVFGFLGPNGAGKSTTIKLLMRLIFPDRGTARILGKSIDDVSMHQETGYLPEQPYFYDYLTAAELLDYFARFHGLTATDRKTRVQNMLKKVGLETAKKIQLRKYSKGMLQRVGLAQAILHDPQVVILDEPMSGLDPLGRREVRDIILELKKDGRRGHAGRNGGNPDARDGSSIRGGRGEEPAAAGQGNTDRRALPGADARRRVVRSDRAIAGGGGADSFGGADQADAGRVFYESCGSGPGAGQCG
jgi:ABC-type Na+ transport system ATPase subunit NatA